MKTACLAIAAALACSPAAAQTLFKCVQPNGRTLYQDSPCDDKARQSTVRAPDTPQPLPLPPGDERRDAAPAGNVESVVQALIAYQGCAQDVPGFATRHRASYNDWRLRNGPALASYSRDEKAQERVREALLQQVQNAPTDPRAKEERAQACEKDVASTLAPPNPSPGK